MKKLLIKLLLYLLRTDEPPRGSLSRENYIVAMSKLYQNPAFNQYLDDREDYLIKKTMNLFLKNELTDAKGPAGQLLEVRSLRNRTKACYDYKRKVADDVKKKTSPRNPAAA